MTFFIYIDFDGNIKIIELNSGQQQHLYYVVFLGENHVKAYKNTFLCIKPLTLICLPFQSMASHKKAEHLLPEKYQPQKP